MLPLAEVVNWAELGESVAAGAIAAIALTIVVSFGIRGTAKYVDFSQEGRTTAAFLSLAVGGLSVFLSAAMVVLGIYMMVAG